MSSSPLTDAELQFTGSPAAPGVGFGQVTRLVPQHRPPLFINVLPHRVALEIERVKRAMQRARRHLESVKQHFREQAGQSSAYLLDPYILMLDDAVLTQAIEDNIRHHRINAEWAVKRAVEDLLASFEKVQDGYLRQRRDDIRDVGQRLIGILSGQPMRMPSLDVPSVLFTEDLLPTMLAELDPTNLSGIVTDAGGVMTHAAIIARSLGIPAVFGAREALDHGVPGTPCIVDGSQGEVILNPRRATQTIYLGRRAVEQRLRRDGLTAARLPAVTRDGVTCHLLANIEIQSELPGIERCGAQSIGLFRSEFIVPSDADALPDEDTQCAAYQAVMAASPDHIVTIRTFDFSSDTLPSDIREVEPNPALGLHGVRWWLAHQATARTQLRAIIRAAETGRVRILLPRVTCLSELQAARQLLDEALASLGMVGLPTKHIELGAMIETPAAVFIADRLARESDFLSIGSNDLVQYLLASDRGNERVSYLQQSLHPAVLASLKVIVAAAGAANKPLTMCGEMAAQPACAFALLGLGIRRFSLSPAALPGFKSTLRRLSARDAEQFVARALTLDTARAVEACAETYLNA
ncbi:MAG: phosphoenolpyruvate--protein phosphotransferase [Chloracidobacterium sp.]|uniref:Phosphoenolpyruvate-protein phosphotransferase n=1 Tax=Chloracidobacterium validum TaxID=2821543 RepID=A0ABX8BBL9_9BACT|nr:phosphoenolpyruvate--protein phosphotransferase [Chloracidobacterium validum]QUW03044.1 phosphoenolpyruvate--protein phosphotransferase [Chloracidobacterium validum]